MRKLLLPIVCLFLGACSVDSDLNEHETPFNELNAIVEVDGCEVESYDFGNVGEIQVINNSESLFVTITSTRENFDLSSTKLHISGSESGFPTVGRGNLPPGKMDHKIDFESGVESYTFEFSLANLEECFYIASQSTFSSSEESITSWAGDYNVKHGNWSYFKYCKQECLPVCEQPVYTGPSDLSGTITYTEAQKIPSVDEARKLFSNQIGQTGKYHGNGHDFENFSRYSPTIEDLVEEFNTVLDEPFDTYDLKTTYSYGDGECAGTIDITLTIVDDRRTE